MKKIAGRACNNEAIATQSNVSSHVRSCAISYVYIFSCDLIRCILKMVGIIREYTCSIFKKDKTDSKNELLQIF